MVEGEGEGLDEVLAEVEERSLTEGIKDVVEPAEFLESAEPKEEPPAPSVLKMEDIQKEIKKAVDEKDKHWQSVVDKEIAKGTSEARRQAALVTMRTQQLEQRFQLLEQQRVRGLEPEEQMQYRLAALERDRRVAQQPPANPIPPMALQKLAELGISPDDPRIEKAWEYETDFYVGYRSFLDSLGRIYQEEVAKAAPEEKRIEPEEIGEVKAPPETVGVESPVSSAMSVDFAEVEKLYIEDPIKYGAKYAEARKKAGLDTF